MSVLESTITIGLTLLPMALTLLGITSPLRTGAGFLLISLLPGYSFLGAFYRPYRDDCSYLEHIALAIPTSLALNTILGLLLNQFDMESHTEMHTLWIGIFTCVIALLPIFKKRISQNPPLPMILAAVIGILGSVLLVSLLTYIPEAQIEETFTSLYILDANDQAIDYPIEIPAGAATQVKVGGFYDGAQKQQTWLMSPNGDGVLLTLYPGEAWEKTFELSFTDPGLYKATWSLYRLDQETPYRLVQLWIRVQ